MIRHCKNENLHDDQFKSFYASPHNYAMIHTGYALRDRNTYVDLSFSWQYFEE